MVTRTPSDTMANSRKKVVPICLPLYSIHAFVFDDYHGPKRQALLRKPDSVSLAHRSGTNALICRAMRITFLWPPSVDQRGNGH